MRVLAALLWGSVTLLAPPGAGLGDRGESRAALHGLARLAGLGVGGAPARAQSDATAPVPVSAMANGATLVLSFDEELAAAPHLVNSAFTVKRTVGGSEETVSLSSGAMPIVNGRTVRLSVTLAKTDRGVKVSYTAPGSGHHNRLADAAGNRVASFTEQEVVLLGEPVNFRVVMGDRKATLSWEEPFRGVRAVTDYEYRYGEGSTVAEETPWISTGSPLPSPAYLGANDFVSPDVLRERSLRVSHLENNRVYTFQVRAVSGGVRGPVSSISGAPQPDNPIISPWYIEMYGGVAQVGGTIYTAPVLNVGDLAALADPDGLAYASKYLIHLIEANESRRDFYEYFGIELFRVGSDGTETPIRGGYTQITGRTEVTYTFTEADVGKRIRSKVLYEDDRGNTNTGSYTFPVDGTIRAAAPCRAPALAGEKEQLWSSAAHFLFSPSIYGYSTTTEDAKSGPHGSLADDRFTVDGTEYRITDFYQDVVEIAPASLEAFIGRGNIVLNVDPVLPAGERKKLTLYVCDAPLRLADATLSDSDRDNNKVDDVHTWSPAQRPSGADPVLHARPRLYLSRDGSSPRLVAGEVDGSSLKLRFDEDLAAAANLANSAFTVKKTPLAGVEEAVSLNGAPSVSGRTVTLSLASPVAATDRVTVGYSVPDGGSANRLADGAGNAAAGFTARWVRNLTAGVVAMPVTLSVNEGGGGVYTVQLNSAPAGTVTVTPSSSDPAAVTVAPASLAFATANWNTARTVTVTAVEDGDENDETVTVRHGVSGYGSVTSAGAVTVTVMDNDVPGVALPSTVNVDEDGTATYTVKLNILPTGNVTITPSSNDTAAVTVAPASLAFTPSTWSSPRTVTVTGVQDDDTDNDTVTVRHGVSGYGGVSSAATVKVTVVDDDPPTVTATPARQTISEGAGGVYGVQLESRPNREVTVTASSSDTATATVSPATLVFSPRNWNDSRLVTVTAAEDMDPDNATVTISHGVSGYGSGGSGPTVTVTVANQDSFSVVVSPASHQIIEGSNAAYYRVKLNTQPTGNVTVTASSSDTAAATVSPPTLTFTTANWSMTRMVTVTAVENDDGNNETVTVSHGISGGGYDDVTVDDVTVTIHDPPVLSSITATGNTMTLTYSKTLQSSPDRNTYSTYFSVHRESVEVVVSRVVITGKTVILTLAQTLQNGQKLTVSYDNSDSIVRDNTDNDAAGFQNLTVTVGAGPLVRIGGICNRTPAVQTAILEKVSGITNCADITAAHLSGITGTLNLDGKSLASLQENDFSGLSSLERIYLDSNNLVSLPANIFSSLSSLERIYLNNNNLVSLPANIFSDLSSLTLISLSNNNLVSLPANIFSDLSSLTLISLSNNNLVSLPANIFSGLSKLSNILLANNNLSSLDEDIFSEVPPSLNVQIYLSNNNLEIIPTRSLLSALSDGGLLLIKGNRLSCLSRALVEASKAVFALDEVNPLDCYGVSLSVSPTEVREGSGATRVTVTASLAEGNRIRNEATEVTVSLEEGTASEGADFTAVSDFTVTIAADSSSNTGVFTLMAKDDGEAEGRERVKVTGRTGLSASQVPGTEVRGAELTIRGPLEMRVEPAALAVIEAGSAVYTVALQSEPDGDVTVTPSSSDAGAATISPATLTFATATWNTARTVTVTAGADGDTANETVTVSHGVSGYGSLSRASAVTVTVVDDDTAGLVVSPPRLGINEEDSALYTVKLATRPVGEVTITPASSDTAAATVSPATLTFTTATWNTARTVTVTAGVDDDAAHETVTVSHGASGYGSLSTASGVTVTVNDDDTAGVALSATTLTVDEGGTATYAVKLSSQPAGTVTITPASSDPAAATVSPATLIFTPSTWSTARTVTVAGVEDAQAKVETVTVRHGVSGYAGVSSAAAVAVTVVDNDPLGLTLNPASLTLNEGAGGTYTVKLDSKPSGTVTIVPSSGNTGAATVSPATLTFTTANWNTARTVSITALDDADVNNETVAVRHAVSGAGGVTSGTAMTVTVTDPDMSTGVPAVMISPDNHIIQEGDGETYTVRLDSEPSGTVTIIASSSDTGAATVSPATLSFTTANWSTPQTVSITALDDADGNNETVSISHGISGGGYGSVTATAVAVTVLDPPALARAAGSDTTLTLTYNKALDRHSVPSPVVFRVEMDNREVDLKSVKVSGMEVSLQAARSLQQSGRPVTVSYTVPGINPLQDTVGTDAASLRNRSVTVRGVGVEPGTLTVTEGETGGSYTVKLNTQPTGNVTVTASSGDTAAATVSPATLTFTTSSWNTARTVTVTGVEDADATDETVTVSHGVSGYTGVNSASAVTVTVNDDDVPGVMVDPVSLTVDEGMTGTYAMKLATRPVGDVTITPSSDDMAAATVSPATLTFTTSSWNSAQTVTVTGVEDADATDETVAISHGVRGYGSVSTASNVTVTVNDDETAGVRVDPTTLTVTEDGSGTYALVLESQPSGSVTITPGSDDSGAASFSPATLIFSTSNWNTARTVTVTGVEDADATDETVTVSHGVSGYTGVSSAPALTVTVNDNDVPGVMVDPVSLTVDEGGTATYTVKLNTLPGGDVTITPSSDDMAAATVSPATLTFTPSTWSSPRTVTVTGVQDDDTNNETVTVRHGVSGYTGVTSAPALTVTVNDNDVPGVMVDPVSLTVDEGGTATYTVKLNTLPTGNVTITPSSNDTAAASISPATLTFTTSSWSTAQTVTVTGVQDDDTDNETVTVSHGVSGYGSVTSGGAVTVAVRDDDGGVTITPLEPATLSEGGRATYTMALLSQPGGDVTVTASSSDTGAATVSPATLTFTTSSWNSAQTVTVSGVEDDDGNDETVTILHGVNGYEGVSSVDAVTLTISDDDMEGVSLSATTLTVAEGGSGSYTVKLDTLPGGDVTVTASSSDTAAATISPATLIFTTSSWNSARTVTVTGMEDPDADRETVTISHEVSGYGTVSTANGVTVTVNDDDRRGASISPARLAVREGETGRYTLVLDTLPSAEVTVTASSGDGGAVIVSPVSLTFTPATWNTARTLTITAVQDDDGDDETVAIVHSSSGGDYEAVGLPAVAIVVSDDDGVSISPTSLSLNEGDSDNYTVVLESEPTGTVTITASSGDGGAATVSPINLTFSSTTWNTPQTVTITALQDDDNEDETVAISHSVSGYGSISSADTVTVTVRDDDEATGEAVIRAWLPRFGRSVAQQVVERVSRRLQQSPQTGLEVSVAGEQLSNRGPWEEEQGIMAKLLGFETVSEGQLVEGTEFAFSPSQPHGAADENGNGEGLVFWGAGELSSFNGQQDTISLSATVTTALVAADWQSQRWQAGTALAHSWGRGSYEESSSGAEGQISSNLTGLFPYGRYALNPKLNLWGMVGHGWGHLSLLPQEGEQQSTSIEMSMAAVGLDGLLLDGGGSGLTIRSRADALLLGVNSEQTPSLAGVQGEVSRLRLGLEAERPFPTSQNGAVLTPSLALAIRQDGGDAETGFGLDLAASLLWTDPLKGMEVEVAGRSLLSHGDQSFHEQGLAASFSWDPNPSSSLGPSLSLSQSMGASASSGSDALLNPTAWPELETSTSAAEVQQFAGRMGYGLLAYRDALLITPELGVALSSSGATTSLGFSLSPYSQQGYSYPWEVVVERQHHSKGNSDNPTTRHSLQLRFSLLF